MLFNSYSYEEVESTAQSVLKRTKCRPHIGIICGSGLGGLANALEEKEILPYCEIDGFPVSTGNYLLIFIFCHSLLLAETFSSLP